MEALAASQTERKPLKAPFPAFGGKSAIAGEFWRRIGTVRNYVEPFCRSCAVLLLRPAPFDGTETVNDLDGWVANFWRSLQADPEAVAFYADWPVSELDLHARGDWLFYRPEAAEWIEKLRADPEFYDAKSAGWWVWGSCCWIAGGWGPRQLPHLGDAGQGVHRQLPHLGKAGQGVHRQLPHLGDAGQGDEPQTSKGAALLAYLRQLAERLRGVRVCCGDWSRVCGPSPTVKIGLTAVFLDPPYSVADRADCYDSTEDYAVAHDVREWCKEWENDRRMRIALCGYAGEHDELESRGWDVFAWKANGGYGSRAKEGNENCKRERIWFSPHCLKPEKERMLFA